MFVFFQQAHSLFLGLLPRRRLRVHLTLNDKDIKRNPITDYGRDMAPLEQAAPRPANVDSFLSTILAENEISETTPVKWRMFDDLFTDHLTKRHSIQLLFSLSARLLARACACA